MYASYQEQLDSLQSECFGDSNFYSEGLEKAGWDTEDLLSDINIFFSADGHSVDQDFAPGLESDMWD